MKTCSKCNIPKLESAFDKARGDKKKTYCRECENKAQRERYAKDKQYREDCKQRSNSYRFDNKKKVTNRQRADFQKNKRKLSDSYIKQRIRSSTGIASADITPAMIAEKSVEILISRLKKKTVSAGAVKNCNNCQTLKPIKEFQILKIKRLAHTGKKYYNNICRSCHNAKRVAYEASKRTPIKNNFKPFLNNEGKEVRRCRRCEIVKEIECFYIKNAVCKRCRVQHQKEYYLNNPDKDAERIAYVKRHSQTESAKLVHMNANKKYRKKLKTKS